ncbi:MAG: PLP-dependent aminotransferase family protein, partial [Eubacteriales bacterium]|nr:PLP-dependent aminotransferase family protein [Eubacteriales bacterium]
SHHFPTGVVMPVPRRMQLLAWAAEQPGRYLIEDDYDSEFRFSSRPMPALKELDRLDRVIYLNTFAKSLAPSLRIGYMVLPGPLMARFQEQFSLYSSSVPAFEQHTLARFMNSGAFERHISRSRNVYKGRLDALLAALRESPLAACTEVRGAEAGLHILLRVKNGLSEDELVRYAAAKGVRVYGLSAYYAPGSSPERATVILGYAGIDSSRFREAVALLSAAWL